MQFTFEGHWLMMGITLRLFHIMNYSFTLYDNMNLDNIALFKSTDHDIVIEIHINIASFVPADHIG